MWHEEQGREDGAPAQSPVLEDADPLCAPSPTSDSEDADPSCSGDDQPRSRDSGPFKPLCPYFEHMMVRLPSSDFAPAGPASAAASQAGTLSRTCSPLNVSTSSPVDDRAMNSGTCEKPSIQLAAFQSARIHDASKRQTDQNLVPLLGFKKPPSLLPPRPDSPAAADWARWQASSRADAGECSFDRASNALPRRVAPCHQDLTVHGWGSWKEQRNEKNGQKRRLTVLLRKLVPSSWFSGINAKD